MALDYGSKRIGVATGNTEIAIAHPQDVVSTINQIIELVKSQNISKIIIGLPLQLDASDSDTTKATRKFFAKLTQALPKVEFQLWEERFSTNLVNQQAIKLKIKQKDQRNLRDSAVAALLLQEYFDSK